MKMNKKKQYEDVGKVFRDAPCFLFYLAILQNGMDISFSK